MSKQSAQLEDLEDKYLDCRDKGHHWKHVTDNITASYRGKIKEICRLYKCRGCDCAAEETLDVPSFDVVKRVYTYPDGYLLAKTAMPQGQRLSVRDIRREKFSRRSGFKF